MMCSAVVEDGCVSVVVGFEFVRRPGSTGGRPWPIPWAVTGAGPVRDTTPVRMMVTNAADLMTPITCGLFLLAGGFEIRVGLALRRLRFRRRIGLRIERVNRLAEAHPITVEHLGLQLVEREVGIVVRDVCGGDELSQVPEVLAGRDQVGARRKELLELRRETMVACELIGRWSVARSYPASRRSCWMDQTCPRVPSSQAGPRYRDVQPSTLCPGPQLWEPRHDQRQRHAARTDQRSCPRERAQSRQSFLS